MNGSTQHALINIAQNALNLNDIAIIQRFSDLTDLYFEKRNDFLALNAE